MLPSNARSFGRTRKYGTRVPSFEVAKCCSTTCRLASKNSGIDFSGWAVASGWAASASSSVVGDR